MKILALEASGTTGSVAALDEATQLRELALEPSQRSAQSLAPGIAKLLANVGWKPKDVELVAVTVGPGSFTGLRIGVMTAKTFAYATGASLLGVNSLEVVASRAGCLIDRLEVIWDAQRKQLFIQTFRVNAEGHTTATGELAIVDRDAWLESSPTAGHVTGPGLELVAANLPPGMVALERELWFPTAAAVGRLAARKWEQGQRDTIWTLVPQYYRRSAAEEKAGLKQS